MTLRTRLVVGLVLLAGTGLLVANVVVASLLRSFLVDRVDDQVGDAALVVRPLLLTEAQTTGAIPGPMVPGPGPNPPGVGQRPGGAGVGRALGVVGLTATLHDPESVVRAEVAFPPGDATLRPELTDPLPTLEAGERRWTEARSAQGTDLRVVIEGVPVPGGAVWTQVTAVPLVDVDETLRQLVLIEAVVTLAVLAALAGGALWVVRAGLAPLRRVEDTADDIAAGDLSRRVEVGDTRGEVARLARTFNTMLDRIEASFAARQASEERLRRFLSDASHELRTPLTSIRGYAELFRRGAADRPEDLEASMRRIEEEAARMGVLVDDLLLLARLEEGRAPERAVVDLGPLVDDGVRDARVTAPDHRIEWQAPDASVVVLGEADRLRGVVANLLGNATRHTPAGTTVRASLTEVGTEAVFEVADDGPGLAEAEAARVFDRFARADPGRTRDRGGTGLGLAITRAVVEAHGGRIGLHTAPGAGARFEVRLPLAGRTQVAGRTQGAG